MTAPPFIVLSKQDLTVLMPFGEYVDAVADAFRMHTEGRSIAPAPMHIPAGGGGFHVKAGSLPIGPGYTAIKVNGNFPNNRLAHGLPTIQGATLFLALGVALMSLVVDILYAFLDPRVRY